MTTFDDYKDAFECFRLERTGSGVLTIVMHTDGGPVVINEKSHREAGEVFAAVAVDEGNEVVVFTGTGDTWVDSLDLGDSSEPPTPQDWDKVVRETQRVLEGLCNIRVPVIAAINGPAYVHGEYALLADIVLASDTVYFQDRQHLPVGSGVVPADGVQIIYPEVMGRLRGHYFLLTMERVDAQEALRIGMVNEVLSSDRLLPRAYEVAESLLGIHPLTRRYTRAIFTRRIKRRLAEELVPDMGLEGLSIQAGSDGSHGSS